MAEEEENRKSRVPLFCGVGCLACITALLLTTEWLTDASVMLLKVRLCLLSIFILPFIMIGSRNNSAAKTVSVVSLVCVLVICATMFRDRNRVVRIYIPDESINESQTRQIEELMERPIVLLIGGKPGRLPESLSKYNRLGEDFYRQVSGRMKPDEVPEGSLPEDDITTDRLRSARYSGIAERVILLVPSQFINGENHSREKYDEIK